MFPTRAALALALAVLTLSTGTAPAQTRGSSTGKGGPSVPQVDLVLVNAQINESAKTVTVTVRLDGPQNRPGLAAAPVRLTVSGGGETFIDQTKTTELPMNATRTITFTNVNVAAIKAQVGQQPMQAVRFVSVAAKVDPQNAVGEGNEGNNTFLRILPAN